MLKCIQKELEKIYRLQAIPSVEQFLISTQEMKQTFPSHPVLQPQVLVQESKEQLRLGVHMGDDLLSRIANKEIQHLPLNDFCSIVEEVSHFLYVCWSAENYRPISLLDLELQGEIDKYLLALRYFSQEQNLFSKMFLHIQWDSSWSEEARMRYEKANQLGSKFILSLHHHLKKIEQQYKTLLYLRMFYRLGSAMRVSKIACL